MVRSQWKQTYQNYLLVRMVEKEICQQRVGQIVSIRNKATLLSKMFLEQILGSQISVRVYTGKVYIRLRLSMSVLNTRVGEYVFTKWRTRRIHFLSSGESRNLSKRGNRAGVAFFGGKNRPNKIPRRGPVWSLRVRLKEDIDRS